jgi:hypothetical protein
VLTLAGTGRQRSVRLSGATRATVEVPAKGSIAVPVRHGVVVLRNAEGVRAGVSYAGADAVAGYPVAAADQEAVPVRISR